MSGCVGVIAGVLTVAARTIVAHSEAARSSCSGAAAGERGSDLFREAELHADDPFDCPHVLFGDGADTLFQALFAHRGDLIGHGFAPLAAHCEESFRRIEVGDLARDRHNLDTIQ